MKSDTLKSSHTECLIHRVKNKAGLPLKLLTGVTSHLNKMGVRSKQSEIERDRHIKTLTSVDADRFKQLRDE